MRRTEGGGEKRTDDKSQQAVKGGRGVRGVRRRYRNNSSTHLQVFKKKEGG
jgi:hypothetical protein